MATTKKSTQPPKFEAGHIPDSGEQPAYRQAGGEAKSVKWNTEDEHGQCVNPQTCRPSSRALAEVPERAVPQMVALERALRNGGVGMADCCLSQVLDLRAEDLPALRARWRPGMKVICSYVSLARAEEQRKEGA